MTVLDTSGAVDFLLGGPASTVVGTLMLTEGELAAPDVLVFEVIAVLRRLALGGMLEANRAAGAVADLGDLPVSLFPSLPLRQRAWQLRANLTAADGLFVALAELLGEPLATKDRALMSAAGTHPDVSATFLALS